MLKWVLGKLKDKRGFMGIAEAAIIGAVVGGGASIAGAMMSSDAQQSAANTQASAANNATQVQWNQFLQQRADQAPWLQAGTSAINQLSAEVGAGGRFAYTPRLNLPEQTKYTMADFKNDPLYQVMQNQQANILASNRAGAASGGSLGSGNQMVALQALAGQNAEGYFQQGYANKQTDYNTAVQNAIAEYNAGIQGQSAEFNRLASIAGTGQTAVNQIGAAGQTAATNVANIGTNAANNIAGTQINAGNVMAGMVGNVGNALTSGIANYQNQQAQQNLLQTSQNIANGYGPSPTVIGYDPYRAYAGDSVGPWAPTY